MRALHRKLLRELWAMRGQALAIALVISSGIAVYIMSISTYESLDLTRESYYRSHRFAEVFARLKRAPNNLRERLQAIPGVDTLQTRVVALVNLQVAGFDEPVTGQLLSLPDHGEPRLNLPYLHQGRTPEPGRNDEVLISEAFAEAHGLNTGDHLSAIINGRKKRLTIVGLALSPETIYEIGPGAIMPDYKRFGVLWMAYSPLASAYDMEGAFNDLSLTLVPGTRAEEVVTRLDTLLEPYGGRAAALPPAEAMRPEPPTVYHATLVERLGLQRWFSQPTRMLLRHIERRPLKALLTVFGITAACGVMMVGNFQEDAIDYMVKVQYGQSQREDISVAFTEPAQHGALSSLRHLEGAERAEGYRSVPARLRYEHRSVRTAIEGVEADGELLRILDTALRPIPLPPEGIVLTDHLGRRLGVKAGDWLTVEVLEGNRPVRRVPVIGLAKQYMGVSGYMRREALNRLMREGDVISGAYLAVDEYQQAGLFRHLQEMPRVVGTTIREVAIRNFYDIIAETTLFFSFIAALLGAVIAFGVVYNSMRIALSERSRELASLRVLGFTRGEIAYILLGELGLLTLVAIPLGFVIGKALCWVQVFNLSSDLYRVPLVLEHDTYAVAAAVVLGSAAVSALLIWRKLGHLDLVAVLKTKE